MNSRLFILIAILLSGFTLPGLAQGLPDPTRPAEYQDTQVVLDLPNELINWKVTAIRISEGDRSAIVNGNIVRAGDTVGTAKILEIQPIQVILDDDNRKIAVRLFRDVTLRKPVK